MKIQKEAALLAAGVPDEKALAKIRAFSKAELSAEEVYAFQVRLCDDQTDRDFERFDTGALTKLAELFVGKTGIMDHNWSAEGQVARIFDAEVQEEAGVHYICAHCYMLRSEKNAVLIREIEGGIKREVSVSCAMSGAVCSVCGKEYGVCEHRKGVTYDGKQCVAVLCGPTDAYEFSFVAVPAQRQAGVMKALGGGEDMTLTQWVEKSGNAELCGSYRLLEKEAEAGRQYRKSLLARVVSLGVLLDFGAGEETLEKSFGALEISELATLVKAMESKAAALFPAQCQLEKASNHPAAMDAAYMI